MDYAIVTIVNFLYKKIAPTFYGRSVHYLIQSFRPDEGINRSNDIHKKPEAMMYYHADSKNLNSVHLCQYCSFNDLKQQRK
jgi:hypothetical protein